MSDKKKQKADYDENSRNEDSRCILKGYDDCKGYVIRIQVGFDFIDICIRHATLLKKSLEEEGF